MAAAADPFTDRVCLVRVEPAGVRAEERNRPSRSELSLRAMLFEDCWGAQESPG